MLPSDSEEGHAGNGLAAPFVYGLVLSLVILVVYFMPRADSDVAILVSPFAGRTAAVNAVARADGLVVDTGRWRFLILARPAISNDPNFPARLYGAGALVVFNPGIMTGCVKKG